MCYRLISVFLIGVLAACSAMPLAMQPAVPDQPVHILGVSVLPPQSGSWNMQKTADEVVFRKQSHLGMKNEVASVRSFRSTNQVEAEKWLASKEKFYSALQIISQDDMSKMGFGPGVTRPIEHPGVDQYCVGLTGRTVSSGSVTSFAGDSLYSYYTACVHPEDRSLLVVAAVACKISNTYAVTIDETCEVGTLGKFLAQRITYRHLIARK